MRTQARQIRTARGIALGQVFPGLAVDHRSERCWYIAWFLGVRFHADGFGGLPGQRFRRVLLQVPDDPAGVAAATFGILHVIAKHPYVRPGLAFFTFYGSKLIPCPPHTRPPFSVAADRALSFAAELTLESTQASRSARRKRQRRPICRPGTSLSRAILVRVRG